MPALGWLLNLGFAGGTVAAELIYPSSGNTWDPQERYHGWEPLAHDRTCNPGERPERDADTWTPHPQNT